MRTVRILGYPTPRTKPVEERNSNVFTGSRIGIWIFTFLLSMISYVRAETDGRARIQVGHEVDTNPQRLVSPRVADHLMRMVLEAELSHAGGVHRWSANYLGGLKLHIHQHSEDLIATQLNGFYSFTASSSCLLGARLSFLDTSLREHDRDYTNWTGDLFFRARLMSWLSLVAHIGGSFFHFKPDGRDLYRLKFSHLSPTGELRLGAELSQRLLATSFYRLEWRFFDDRAYRMTGDQLLRTEIDRVDLRHMTGLTIKYEFETFKNKIMIVELSYSLFINDSNSTGSSANWHRLKLAMSLQLPLNINLHVMGTLQLTQFKDGLYIEGNLYEPEADENENSVVLRLSIPIWQNLSLVIQGGLYRNDFHSDNLEVLPFYRETFMLGLDYELPF